MNRFTGLFAITLAATLGCASSTPGDEHAAVTQAPLWSHGQSMTTRRTLHQVAALDDGHALIMGGAQAISFDLATGNVSVDPLASAEIWDEKAGTFTATAPMNVTRILHTATHLPDGRVLVIGGASSLSSGTNTAEVFDPATSKWSFVRPSDGSHAAHTATLLPDGRVLVIGGFLQSEVEIYDPKTDTWSVRAAMGKSRGGHTTTVLPSGKVLVAGGGTDWTNASDEVFLYDPVTDERKDMPPMSTPRVGHVAGLLPSGKVIVVGGANGSVLLAERLATAEIFDPKTKTWSPAPTANAKRAFAVSHVLPSGNFVVIGGDPNGILSPGDEKSAEVFDESKNAWIKAGNMNIGRTAPASLLLADGRILVTGGFDGTCTESTEILTLAARGAACTSGSACESGLCADGHCCDRACRGACESCETGTCLPRTGVPLAGHETCNGFTCGASGCATSCTSDAECVSGFICTKGACVPDNAPRCSADRHAIVAAGATVGCGAYLCVPSADGHAGACGTSCSSTGDCAVGYACDRETSLCVAAASTARSGGCAYGGVSGGGAVMALLLALGAVARRQR